MLQNSNHISKEAKQFKLVIVGDGGVGKTTYCNRLKSGQFEKEYIATLGVEVHPIEFKTSSGDIIFNCWDTAGQERFGGSREGYYIKGDAAIVMFDVTSMASFEHADKWFQNLRNMIPNVPMVLCGTKVDHKVREVMPGDIKKYIEGKNIQYYDISSKTNYNFEKPFLHAARKLIGNENLVFIEKDCIKLDAFDQEFEDIYADMHNDHGYDIGIASNDISGYNSDQYEEDIIKKMNNLSFSEVNTNVSNPFAFAK